MIPVDQTVLHDPDNGKLGNCFSAVLASLLHMRIEQVPMFTGEGWQRQLNAWIRPFGLAYLEVQMVDGHLVEIGVEGLHHEIAGKTNRFKDTLHACVGVDGVIVHDPHPSATGLLQEGRTLGLFVALAPWAWKAKVQVGPLDV